MIGVARAVMDAAGTAPERVTTATADDDSWSGRWPPATGRALELLYRRHAPWLAGRLAARTSSRDLAEEALQDTFLAAWRGARAYHGTGEVPAWLWGIARRRLASLARRQPRGGLSLDPAGERVDPAAGPEEAALGQDASARIRRGRRPPPGRAAGGDHRRRLPGPVDRAGRPGDRGPRGHHQEPPAPGAPAHPQGAAAMTEHPTELLLQIADGATPPPEARAHLATCQRCHQTLEALAPLDLGYVWEGVAAELDAPRPGLLERLLVAVGVRPGLARFTATTPTPAPGLAAGQRPGAAAGRPAAGAAAGRRPGRRRCCWPPPWWRRPRSPSPTARRSTRPMRRWRPPRCRRCGRCWSAWPPSWSPTPCWPARSTWPSATADPAPAGCCP